MMDFVSPSFVFFYDEDFVAKSVVKPKLITRLHHAEVVKEMLFAKRVRHVEPCEAGANYFAQQKATAPKTNVTQRLPSLWIHLLHRAVRGGEYSPQ